MLISLFYFVVVLQLVRFGKCVGPDYVANFSLASETNPLKIKLAITWRTTQPRRAAIQPRQMGRKI